MATIDVRMPDGSIRAFPARPPREADEPLFMQFGYDLVPSGEGWTFWRSFYGWSATST